MDEKNKALVPYLEMGVAFMLGLAIGIAFQKILKIMKNSLVVVAVVLILGSVFVFLLEDQGIFTLNQEHLQNTVDSSVKEMQSALTLLQNKLNAYKGTGSISLLVGFIIGMKIA